MDCQNAPDISLLRIEEQKRSAENERRNLAIRLDICPCCGEPLIEEKLEIYDKPKVWFFGLIVYTRKLWDNRKICSKDKSHYEHKSMYRSMMY